MGERVTKHPLPPSLPLRMTWHVTLSRPLPSLGRGIFAHTRRKRNQRPILQRRRLRFPTEPATSFIGKTEDLVAESVGRIHVEMDWQDGITQMAVISQTHAGSETGCRSRG